MTTFGGPEVLEVLDLPDPTVGPGELRIRVHAAAVNPTDTLLRSGARADDLAGIPPPYVPGMEVAGVLEQIGEGAATDLEVGDHVMAIVLPSGVHGAYAERVVVPAESAARAPAGANEVEASTLPLNGLTARLALDLLELGPGQAVAVTGAAGAVGGFVVQLAKAEGLNVVADASPPDEPVVRGLGADVVVPRGPDVSKRIRQAMPAGVDGLVDAALLGDAVVPALRDGGRIATLRRFVGQQERGVSFHPVHVRHYSREQAKLDRLRRQVEDGQVTLRVARTFPGEQAAEAHRILEAGGTRGRLVLRF